VHALANSLTDLSLIVNRKIIYWIAMCRIIILPYQFSAYQTGLLWHI